MGGDVIVFDAAVSRRLMVGDVVVTWEGNVEDGENVGARVG